MIKNDRLWKAVRALATHKGDARHRVALACQILEPMRSTELPTKLWHRLEKVKNDAGKKGALVINGKVIKDRYDNSITLRQNKTYSKLAEEILRIYEDFNSI